MYAWIWRRLPGTGPAKALIALALVLLVVAALWYVVFPWAEPRIRFDQSTIEDDRSRPAPTQTATPSP